MADARVLKILLGDTPVGHLTGFQDGKSLFAFDDSYIDLGPGRPTLSLSFNTPGDEEATERKLREIYSSRMKLPPFFSNLLPEGVLPWLGRVRKRDEFNISSLHSTPPPPPPPPPPP